TDRCVELVNVATGRPSHTIYYAVMRGFSADRDGNLLVTNAYEGVFRYKRQASGMGPAEKIFGGVPDGPNGVWKPDSVFATRGAGMLAFYYPLCGSHWQTSGVGCTQASTPVKSLQFGNVAFPVRGHPGTSITAVPPDDGAIDFAVNSAGDAVWIADRWNSRVF